MGLNWFRLHFVENEGMAWGWKMGGEWGKVALTLFRLAAVIAGVFIIRGFIKNNYHRGFIYLQRTYFRRRFRQSYRQYVLRNDFSGE